MIMRAFSKHLAAQWRCSDNDGGDDGYGLSVCVGARITAFDILCTKRANDRRGEYFGIMCARCSNNAVPRRLGSSRWCAVSV